MTMADFFASLQSPLQPPWIAQPHHFTLGNNQPPQPAHPSVSNAMGQPSTLPRSHIMPPQWQTPQNHQQACCTPVRYQPPQLTTPGVRMGLGQPPPLFQPIQQRAPLNNVTTCHPNNLVFSMNNVSRKYHGSNKSTSKYKTKKTQKQTKKEVHKLLNKQKYITNLSSKTLSPSHLEVLSLGLTFVPNGSKPQARGV